jgi:hypothetical protein
MHAYTYLMMLCACRRWLASGLLILDASCREGRLWREGPLFLDASYREGQGTDQELGHHAMALAAAGGIGAELGRQGCERYLLLAGDLWL